MNLLQSAVKVGSFTLVSRVLGFVRDQLIAVIIGTSPVAEAFFLAQQLPNLFRAIFAEGAFNNAFVPQFVSKLQSSGEPAAFFFARDVLSVLFAWMIAFCGLAMLVMPWFIAVFAWGFSGSEEKLALTTELTRICFPYLGMMSLTALFGGVLNSLGRFSAAAAAPVLLNIIVICFALTAWFLGLGSSPDTARLLAWAVTTSGAAQLALLLYCAYRAGAHVRPGLPRLTPDVKRLLWLSVPGVVSGGLTQINLFVAASLATGFTGGLAFLYYANRLYQLPLGLIGVAIGVVLLPVLSKRLQQGDLQGALFSHNRALEFALFLTLPATLALIMIGRPILHTLFEHGAFTRADTFAVANVLVAFALGLPAFTLAKIFQPSFFARKDTRTPMMVAVSSVVLNVAASVALSRYYGYIGIALATSLAAWWNAAALIVIAMRRGHYAADQRLKGRIPKMVAALVAMAGVLQLLMFLLSENYAETASIAQNVWGLVALIAAGSVVYLSAALLLGAIKRSELAGFVTRRTDDT